MSNNNPQKPTRNLSPQEKAKLAERAKVASSDRSVSSNKPRAAQSPTKSDNPASSGVKGSKTNAPAGAQRPKSTATKDPSAPRKTQVPTESKKLVKPVTRTKIRKTTLQVSRIRPFTVFRMTLLLTMALAIIFVVCSVILWFILGFTGTIDSINQVARTAGNNNSADIKNTISPGFIAVSTLFMGVVNSLIISVLATLAAVIYNAAAKIVGGFEVTLTDES